MLDATSTYNVLGLFPNACSTSRACYTNILSSVKSLTMVHECELSSSETSYIHSAAYFTGMSNPFTLCAYPYMLPGTSEYVGRSCTIGTLYDFCLY